MSSGDQEESVEYSVVLNDSHQYSIWPVGTNPPSGWHKEGTIGSKHECLNHIKRIWNMPPPVIQLNGSIPYFQHKLLLHELVEIEAVRSPESIAVVLEDQQITYRELMDRASRVARFLKHLGIRPELPVCLFMDHSAELVIAILGILKAGGVCVPLDPAYPEEHLDFIFGDTAAEIVLIQEKYFDRLSKKKIKTVTLDAAHNSDPPFALSVEDPKINSENLAFIFFTSGSTGKPKGVMLSHRAIHSHNAWRKSVYKLNRDDRHLFRCPLGFAFLLTEVFLPLLTGGTIVVALPEKRDDTGYLMKLMARKQITMVNFVPSQIRMILEESNLDECASVRNWVTGGEALPAELQKKFYARFNATLSIIYGSTEARSSTLWICPKQQEDRAIAPIGRAAPGKQVYVLDAACRPVNPGETGELYIGGEGIARGYLNRPDLTAEKFVPDPFSIIPGDRLYRTGDLARYHPDHTLEFLGRMDQQVKIRGFRIELGQIESALAEHPDVREAVVTSKEDPTGKKQLIACVVSGREDSPHIFQEWLKQKIPAYMVPSLIYIVQEIPRTAHGKVDLQRLSDRATKQKGHLNAANEIERSLMVIWQQVFGSDQIGVKDNFFELGGDSLLAARILSRVRETLHVNLPFKILFEHATVAELGRILEDEFLPS